MQRRSRQTLRDVAIEFRDRGIDAVAGVYQACKGTEPAREIVNRLIASHGSRKPYAAFRARRFRRELALVVCLERLAFSIDPVEIARDLGRINPEIEIREFHSGRPPDFTATAFLAGLRWEARLRAVADLREAEEVRAAIIDPDFLYEYRSTGEQLRHHDGTAANLKSELITVRQCASNSVQIVVVCGECHDCHDFDRRR